MGLVSFLFRRLVAGIPAVGALVVATFLIMRVLPGDPAVFLDPVRCLQPKRPPMCGRSSAWIRSVPEQLLIYLKEIGTANLGTSFTTGRPSTELAERLPASLELQRRRFFSRLLFPSRLVWQPPFGQVLRSTTLLGSSAVSASQCPHSSPD